MSKVLAIDYGDKRIGIAISDQTQTFAFPKEIIENTSEKEVTSKLIRLCNEEDISLIVVGLPLTLQGIDSDQTIKVREFALAINKNIDLPLEFIDERLTSKQSGKIINFFDKKEKHFKDKHEAKIILEIYLEKIAKKIDK